MGGCFRFGEDPSGRDFLVGSTDRDEPPPVSATESRNPDLFEQAGPSRGETGFGASGFQRGSGENADVASGCMIVEQGELPDRGTLATEWRTL